MGHLTKDPATAPDSEDRRDRHRDGADERSSRGDTRAEAQGSVREEQVRLTGVGCAEGAGLQGPSSGTGCPAWKSAQGDGPSGVKTQHRRARGGEPV